MNSHYCLISPLSLWERAGVRGFDENKSYTIINLLHIKSAPTGHQQ